MIRTTYRSKGKFIPFNYFTKTGGIRCGDGVTLHGWGTYDSNSVLAGQSMKAFVGCFETEAEADAALVEAGIDPAAVNWSSKWFEPQNTFDHLPDGSDW